MKRQLQKLAARVDALTLRERVLLFAASAAAIVFIAWVSAFNPLLAKRATLRQQLSQQQNNLTGIDNEITQKVQAYALDPDAALREKLAKVKADTATLADGLRAMQKGLVAPERIAPLLETILRANGRLQLLSMKTLPVTGLSEPAAAGAAPKPAELLYRHGVELAVRGNYLDMVNYMSTLEAMPTQLFWGKAQLEVEEYPDARLTLTLFTLSLDKKWMTL